MNSQQAAALRAIAQAVCDTVNETNPAPAGPMYAAFQSQGLSLGQFNQIMSGLVKAGYLTHDPEGFTYSPGKPLPF